MILKFNRLLNKKEEAMILEAYEAGFEEGYKVGLRETTNFVKKCCDAQKKGEPLADNIELEKISDGIRIYGEMTEGGKRFFEKLEARK